MKPPIGHQSNSFRKLFSYLVILLLSLPCPAEETAEPFPKKVILQIERIEIPQKNLTQLLFGEGLLKSGNTLREEVQEMVKTGTAKISGLSIITPPLGKQVSLNSYAEIIYPTSLDPPSTPSIRATGKSQIQEILPTGPGFTSFESRPTGLQLTLEARIENPFISLQINSDRSQYLGNIDWFTWKDKRGSTNISMPKFYSMKWKETVTLHSNKYVLLATLTAKDDQGFPDPSKKYMIFLRGVIKEF